MNCIKSLTDSVRVYNSKNIDIREEHCQMVEKWKLKNTQDRQFDKVYLTQSNLKIIHDVERTWRGYIWRE